MTRRISPRHCTETITVRPFAADGTIDGTLGDETTVRRVMVTESRQVVTAGDDVRVVSLLEVRLPDRDGLDVDAIFTPDSQVTYRGSTSIVLTCDRVLHRGQVAFWRITTGDRAPRFGGALPVIVHIVPATGRDTMGDPIPAGPTRTTRGYLAVDNTTDPTDYSDEPSTTGVLHLPAGEQVTSTDRIEVLDGPLAGQWTVHGTPHPDAGALAIPVRRST